MKVYEDEFYNVMIKFFGFILVLDVILAVGFIFMWSDLGFKTIDMLDLILLFIVCPMFCIIGMIKYKKKIRNLQNNYHIDIKKAS